MVEMADLSEIDGKEMSGGGLVPGLSAFWEELGPFDEVGRGTAIVEGMLPELSFTVTSTEASELSEGWTPMNVRTLVAEFEASCEGDKRASWL